MKKRYWSIFVLVIIVILSSSLDTEAQCAMCKATAEQGDQVGLNLGILYLFLMPYTIVATIAFFWWRNRKKEEDMSNGWNRESQLN